MASHSRVSVLILVSLLLVRMSRARQRRPTAFTQRASDHNPEPPESVHRPRIKHERDPPMIIVDASSPAHVGRTVAIPPHIIPILRDHLDRYAEPRPTGLVFIGPRRGPYQ